MAHLDSQVISTHIAVSGGVAQITMGELRISVPVGNIEPLIRILQAARLIAGHGAEFAAPAPAPAPRVATEPRRERTPSRPAPAASPRKSAGSKRRSRKRVGDALEVWMDQNPGWHSEAALLQAVVDHRMTDASPKRALKIALGKQRDELFEGDGNGFWKLVRDADAGAPPKPGTRGAKNKAEAVARRSRVARNANEAVAASERLVETAARRGGRVRLKTRPRTSPHAPPNLVTEPVADTRATGPKRVKKGERQKAGSRAPAAPAAPPAGADLGGERWRGFSRDDVERARKNLLGVGSGAGVRGRGEGEGEGEE
ncbi:MAG: hypothetical protein R3F39_15685 [Myxococcota bacterium]